MLHCGDCKNFTIGEYEKEYSRCFSQTELSLEREILSIVTAKLNKCHNKNVY